MPLPLRVTHVAIIVCSALAAGCHSGPSGLREPDQAALAATARFVALSDSIRQLGVDPVFINGYGGIAGILAAHERITPVRLVLDGVEDDWVATARELGLPGCPTNQFCVAVLPDPPLIAVVAWQRSDPRRVVQLTTSGTATPIDGSTLPVYPFGIFTRAPTLTYLDGRGGVFVAPTGTQSVRVTHTDWPCAPMPTAGNVAEALILSGYTTRCTVAGMLSAFSATVQVPDVFSPRGNSATGSHTLSMAAQTVDGARIELSQCSVCRIGYPGTLLPPLNLRGTLMLPSSLRVTVDSVVTLTLDVFNAESAPTVVQFTRGQRYDFVIRPLAGGAPVWRWGADRSFIESLNSRTLAPGEHWIVSERWHPTVKGTLIAKGLLTSSSHFAEATALFTVP